MHWISKIARGALVFFWIIWTISNQSLAEAPCGGVDAVPTFANANQEIRIADVAFSVSMNGYCPSTRLADRIDKPDSLFFWMRLEGGIASLERLKRDGRLPITHRWVAMVGSEVVRIKPEDIPATDAMGRDAPLLGSEMDDRPFFDWRTKTMKTNFVRGFSYKIEILDALHRPIPCATNLNCLPCRGGIRCAFKMRIQ